MPTLTALSSPPLHRWAIGDAALEKTSLDTKTSLDKTSLDKTSLDKTSLDKTSLDKAAFRPPGRRVRRHR